MRSVEEEGRELECGRRFSAVAALELHLPVPTWVRLRRLPERELLRLKFCQLCGSNTRDTSMTGGA